MIWMEQRPEPHRRARRGTRMGTATGDGGKPGHGGRRGCERTARDAAEQEGTGSRSRGTGATTPRGGEGSDEDMIDALRELVSRFW